MNEQAHAVSGAKSKVVKLRRMTLAEAVELGEALRRHETLHFVAENMPTATALAVWISQQAWWTAGYPSERAIRLLCQKYGIAIRKRDRSLAGQGKRSRASELEAKLARLVDCCQMIAGVLENVTDATPLVASVESARLIEAQGLLRQLTKDLAAAKPSG